MTPSRDLLIQSQQVYKDAISQGRENCLMDDGEICNYLIDRGDWSEEKEKNLIEVLPKHIEYWKEELFKAWPKPSELETVRKYLERAKKELENLMYVRHSLDYISLEGLANYAKTQFIIENSCYLNDRIYRWQKYSPYLAMVYYQDNLISENAIREIAHSYPWDGIWHSGKKLGNLFGKAAIDLSQDQHRLVMWSSTYDSVMEHPDNLSQEIMKDNDLLDGWFIIKRKEKESETKKPAGLNPKIANSDEIYLTAKTMEDAKKIDSMNSSYAKTIKKQRFNAIAKHGEVNELMLPDVNRDLQMAIVNKLSQNVKGRK